MSFDFHRDFFAYDRWANRRVIESLSGLEGADEAVALLAHIIGAQEVWLARVTGIGVEEAEPRPALMLEACSARLDDLHTGWMNLLAESAQERIDRVVAYKNLSGQPWETTVQDILVHVNNHGTYHRGQIARIVKAAGGRPAVTDFIAYVRDVRA